MLHESHSYFEKFSTAQKRREEETFALKSIAYYCFVEIKSNCDYRWMAATIGAHALPGLLEILYWLIMMCSTKGDCLKCLGWIGFGLTYPVAIIVW